MVDDVCGNGLSKYCKANCITFKEYPKCLKPVTPTVNLNQMVNRRKKIPPKSNDSVVSDHETSTSCSEGEDDAAYIRTIKSSIHAVDPDRRKVATSSPAKATTLSLSQPTTNSTVAEVTVSD